MNSPVDGTQLVITEQAGVEIDYCPNCRGVWLDRGELDKIIERTDSEPDYTERHQPDQRSDNHRPRQKKKKEGLLGQIFGF